MPFYISLENVKFNNDVLFYTVQFKVQFYLNVHVSGEKIN